MRCWQWGCEVRPVVSPEDFIRIEERVNMKPIAIVAVSMLLWATSAGAQGTLPFRAYVSVNGAMQVADNDFQDSGTFVEHAEEGRFDTDYSVSHGPALNINGGVKVHRAIGVGVGVTRYSKSTPTQLSGSVPHPFFFDQDRAVAGEVGGLKREEMAIHIRGSYEFSTGPRVQVMAFGGPSFFRVKQGMVTDFTYTDAYPYDTATFANGQVVEAEESKIGFNAGVDAAFFFTRQLGVGGIVQFGGTTLDFASAGGGTQEVKAGGLQAGGGLRLRF
jgi:hypothetical protein